MGDRMLRGEPALRRLALGQVADEGAEAPSPVQPERGDGELDGNLVAGAVQGSYLDAAPQDGALATGKEPVQAALMGVPVTRGYDGRSQAPADRFTGRPAKHRLCLRAPGFDRSVGSHRDHGVQRR